MPPKENEVELSELIALEEQIEDLKDALYDAKVLLKSAIIIPKGATNGDTIERIFGNDIYYVLIRMMYSSCCEELKKWWNAPYKKEVEE